MKSQRPILFVRRVRTSSSKLHCAIRACTTVAALMTPITATAQGFVFFDEAFGEQFELLGRVASIESQTVLGIGVTSDQDDPYGIPATALLDLGSQELEIVSLQSTNNSSGGGTTTIPPDAAGIAFNISGDGETVVGGIDNGAFTPFHAFRWTEEAGFMDLGTLAPNNSKSSIAHDVSGDGSVVIGYSGTSGVKEHAFRWTEATGMVDLDAVDPESHQSQGYAASDDGNVIVGQRDFRAFRWTLSDGFQQLGPTAYFANDVNASGVAVVGQTTSNIAFRWTEGGGVQSLGVLPGHSSSIATSVSDDGNIIVGISSTGFLGRGGAGNQIVFDEASSRAFYWTPTSGMQDLTQLLADAGVDMTGNTLVAALGMSPDGTWIGGAAVIPGTNSGGTNAFFASLTAAAPDGNFNEQGGVDGADLALWKAGYGTTTGAEHMDGDADRDGDVDGRDFLVWQRGGSPNPVVAATGAVPEPATWLLAAGAMCGMLSNCRRGARIND